MSRFAQQVATVNGSLLNLELEGATRALGWLEAIFHIYGNAQATVNTFRPQWDGLDKQTGLANKLDAQSIVASTGIFSLAMLDSLIDAVRVPYAANLTGDNFFFIMSPKMQSKVSQITLSSTRILLDRHTMYPMSDGGVFGAPVTPQLADPGLDVYWYRNIPILETSFLSAPGTMGAVALAQNASTTPFLLNAVRKYVVSAVTLYGETLASAEQSITVAAGTGANGNNVVLTWSTPVINDPFGNPLPILLYRIYESVTAGAETLLAVVPAFDASDVAVTSFTDLGAASVAASLFYQFGVAGDLSTFPFLAVGGNAGGYGSEAIYLCSRNPEIIVVPTVNDITPVMLAPVNARSVQFALIADEALAVRAPLFQAKLERVRFA